MSDFTRMANDGDGTTGSIKPAKRNFQIGSCVSSTGRSSVTVVFCIEAIVIIAPRAWRRRKLAHLLEGRPGSLHPDAGILVHDDVLKSARLVEQPDNHRPQLVAQLLFEPFLLFVAMGVLMHVSVAMYYSLERVYWSLSSESLAYRKTVHGIILC